jgi:hypothetical protein
MTEHSPIVFPVGHYMGERHPEEHHVVRVGLTHQTLTADEFGVWVLAHGAEEIGKGLWTLDAVFDLAEAAGLSGAPGLAASMIESGLLVTVAPGRVAARRFAATYRLNPMLIGLGNTDDEPDRFQLGFPGLPPAAVLDTSAYEREVLVSAEPGPAILAGAVVRVWAAGAEVIGAGFLVGPVGRDVRARGRRCVGGQRVRALRADRVGAAGLPAGRRERFVTQRACRAGRAGVRGGSREIPEHVECIDSRRHSHASL